MRLPAHRRTLVTHYRGHTITFTLNGNFHVVEYGASYPSMEAAEAAIDITLDEPLDELLKRLEEAPSE